MFANYLKVALRNFIKNRSFSVINVAGLTIGMTSVIFIFLWVSDELSFDSYHNDADDIYRIVYADGDNKQVKTHTALAGALKDAFPEIKNTARMMITSTFTFRYNAIDDSKKRVFYESDVLIAEPSLLDVFEYKFVKGDKNTALLKPRTLIITERIAKKYFGDEEPIGKSLLLDGGTGSGFMVTGVVENPPANTHLKFDILLSFQLMEIMGIDTDSWDQPQFFTYIKLVKGVDKALMSSKVENFINEHKSDNQYKILLQPVQDIYLYSEFEFDLAGLGDAKYVYIFTVAAFLILIIAGINFVNLSTARYLPRSKEVGMRKIVGARKSQLIFQYLNESILVCVLAMILAIFIVKGFLPDFNSFTDKNLSFDITALNVGLSLLGIITVTGILGGIYPAIFMASFKPINILRGGISSDNSTRSISNNTLRKTLVVLQFTVSVILIIGSVIINDQLNFIKNMDLGFKKDNTVYLQLGRVGNDYYTIKEELLRDPHIKGMAVSQYLTTSTGSEIKDVVWDTKDPGKEVLVKYKNIGYDYLDLLGVKVVAGRSFSKEFQVDSAGSYIVNKKFVDQYDIKDPIGKRLAVNGKEGRIVGVVENVKYRSLYNEIEPIIHGLFADLRGRNAILGIVYIKIDGQKVPEAIDKITSTWSRIAPNSPPEYHFLDDAYDKLYRSEQVMGTLIYYFTLFGILIACMGLFGLTAYVIEHKLKEICVRKILGASKRTIFFDLSINFLKWVVLSVVIGIPVSYLVMNSWLNNFAYRISIDWKIFTFSAFLVLMIAAATLCFHIIKAIRSNPADSLRYE